jgi:tetratricopeptide (TPR) repeat protein
MVSGRRAFPDENLVRSAIRRVTEDAPALRAIVPSTPVRWDRAIARALARDPSVRPRSAAELIGELEAARPALRMPKWAFSRRTLLYGGLSSTAMAAFYVIWRYRYLGPLIGSGAPAPLLMLTKFAEPADAEPADSQVALLSFLIEKQLGQSGRVRLLPKDRVEDAWTRIQGRAGVSVPGVLPPATARDIALREGAGVVLFGGVIQIGDSRMLGLKLERMGDRPEQPGDFRERSFSINDTRAAAFEAASWIRETLGELNVESRNRKPEELTTRNWHALEEYIQGTGPLRGASRGPAIDHLQEALRADPEFALAAARLGDFLTSDNRPDEGLQYYERAERLLIEKHLTDRESLQIRGIFAFDTGRYDEAEHVFALMADNYPDDTLPLFHRASALDRLGRPEEARSLLDTAIERNPESYVYIFRRAHLLLDSGDIDAAEKDCDRASALSSNDWTDQLRSALAFSRLDFDRGLAHLHRMASQGTSAFQSKAFSFEACFLAEQGKPEPAARRLDQGLQFDRARGFLGETQHAKQRQLAYLLIQMGRIGEAVDRCSQMLDAAPGQETVLQVGIVLARAGQVKDAEKCLPKEEPKWPVHRHWLLRLQGEIAMSRGEFARALDLMRRIPQSRNSGDWPVYLVRAADRTGDREIMARYLTSLFSNPGRYWYEANVSEPGFFRWALGIASARHLTPNQPQAVASLRALEGFFQRR